MKKGLAILGVLGIVGVVFGGGLIYLLSSLGIKIEPLGDAFVIYRVETPEQPIEFPHNKHVKDVGLQCTYCHAYADKAVSPGIPPLEVCMGCHSVIATDKPRIKKLTEYWNKKEPVPWKRVNKLPDFVFFTHKRHVKAGVDCKACHGDLSTMTVAQRVKSLKMGWCLSCHNDVNGYLKSLGLPPAKVDRAPTDCWTCHK